jgi:hypothetical protein
MLCQLYNEEIVRDFYFLLGGKCTRAIQIEMKNVCISSCPSNDNFLNNTSNASLTITFLLKQGWTDRKCTIFFSYYFFLE